ncbi:MAG: hypothetical protein JRI70_04030 [Deltaproteobacteria bacterium]|nr:hypothetical protein [Deltaproteobacteria bacterium]
MKRLTLLVSFLSITLGVTMAYAALEVPTDIQQPGTQPLEVGNLESPNKCDNCHGGYNSSVEPAHNWRGSMMANAGRDPIFWATVAIAEQDFDGSALTEGDSDGVECDFCHVMTNPDNLEHLGVMNAPFVANDGQVAPDTIGYYGSGIASIWGGSDKLGPYSDPEARHQFMQSSFHRSLDFCGSCHDVSNPAVGNLAPHNGTQSTADPVDSNGILGGDVDGKAAFNNFPYQYGVVERTFSEFKSGLVSQTLVDDYAGLPADLKGGALKAIYDDATNNGTRSADYEDGDPRYYTCQSCHMRPVTGKGCNKKGAPLRIDLPLHDMTGGNYWMPEAVKYLDVQGKTVDGDTVRVINHTGHKLISGYPEGRRMWLNIKWYDEFDNPLREDGEYGEITVDIDGIPTQVKSIKDLHGANTKIYEAHYGMTREWAGTLMLVDPLHYGPIVLDYDRETGAQGMTIAQLAAADPGTVHERTVHETFHFVLNNTVIKDDRIPPYGMDREKARQRNALPVPADQYNGDSGTYDYFDVVPLSPHADATYATIDLLYQPTSWEYVQFLYLGNNGQNAFLANEGAYMLEAWLNTGMAEPYVMATATWGTPGVGCDAPVPTLLTATPGNSQATLTWQEIPGDPSVLGYRLYYDQAGKAQLVAELLDPAANQYIDTDLTNGQEYCYKVTSVYDCDGDEVFDLESGFSDIECVTPTNPGQETDPAGVIEMLTGTWVTTGKGKNKTTEFVLTTTFNRGDAIVIRAKVVDGVTGQAISNANVDIAISGPETTSLTSGPSDADGWAEATWNTQAPNRKGRGGTALGDYKATTTDVTATGYHWDNVKTSTDFKIQ